PRCLRIGPATPVGPVPRPRWLGVPPTPFETMRAPSRVSRGRLAGTRGTSPAPPKSPPSRRGLDGERPTPSSLRQTRFESRGRPSASSRRPPTLPGLPPVAPGAFRLTPDDLPALARLFGQLPLEPRFQRVTHRALSFPRRAVSGRDRVPSSHL